MKIGLLTFHNALNYGACLQAYATQQVLQALGFDCECLDYENKARRNAYRMTHQICAALRARQWRSAERHALGLPFMALRRFRFARFRRRYLRVSPSRAHTNEQAQAFNDRYDVFLLGSDQVWNPAHNGGDPAYLLGFAAPGRKKIAYASSFGVMHLPETICREYAAAIRGFDAVSVREEQGAALIHSLTGRIAPVVLDPVLLIGKAHWLTLAGQPQPATDCFFLYANRPDQRARFLALLPPALRQTPLHLLTRYLTPRDFLSRTAKVTYARPPEDFIKEIAAARFVCTASFHGAALAIVLEKPFAVLLTGDMGKDARLYTLLASLGLTDRIITDDTRWADLDAPIDFAAVNRRLEAARRLSLRFLTDALAETQEGGIDAMNGALS